MGEAPFLSRTVLGSQSCGNEQCRCLVVYVSRVPDARAIDCVLAWTQADGGADTIKILLMEDH